MKHLATLGLSASLVLLAGLPAAAHHNGATYFDTSTTIEHSGATVVEYAIVNPHGRLHYTFTDAEGNEQEWSAELASANNLRRRGLGGEIFNPGDQLVSVTGNPSRSGANFMRLESAEFADGTVANFSGPNRGIIPGPGREGQ